MKTFTCGEHKFDELPNGDVQVTVTRRETINQTSQFENGQTRSTTSLSKPIDHCQIIIPKADRQRLGDFIAGQHQLL